MPQVKHYGYFQFNEGTTEETITECFSAMEGMVGSIPGLLDFNYGLRFCLGIERGIHAWIYHDVRQPSIARRIPAASASRISERNRGSEFGARCCVRLQHACVSSEPIQAQL